MAYALIMMPPLHHRNQDRSRRLQMQESARSLSATGCMFTRRWSAWLSGCSGKKLVLIPTPALCGDAGRRLYAWRTACYAERRSGKAFRNRHDRGQLHPSDGGSPKGSRFGFRWRQQFMRLQKLRQRFLPGKDRLGESPKIIR